MQTPQARCANAQASRGSRPRKIFSMPRTIVPDEKASVMVLLASTVASMRKWPSIRVIGSITILWVVMAHSLFHQRVGNQLAQAGYFNIQIEVLHTIRELQAAIRAAHYDGFCTHLLHLVNF